MSHIQLEKYSIYIFWCSYTLISVYSTRVPLKCNTSLYFQERLFFALILRSYQELVTNPIVRDKQ